MRISLIVLMIIAAVLISLGSLAGCSRAIEVTETVGVSDSPQALSSAVIEVEETIGVSDSPQVLPYRR